MATEPIRIGVTGASGFIGRALVKALKGREGIRVQHLKRPRKTSKDPDEVYHSFVHDKDLIFHLAGVNRGEEKSIIDGNILMTSKIVSALQKTGKPTTRIVFSSSSQVYGPAKNRVRETSKTRPSNLYGVVKLASENLIQSSGIKHGILRLANVYGPGCKPDYNSVIATFCHRAILDEPLQINGSSKTGRDFVFIDDAVEALILAGINESANGIYNVGSGKIHSLKQVIGHVKKKIPSLKVIQAKNLNTDPVSFCLNSHKFRQSHSWRPQITLGDGLQKTLLWFKGAQHARH